MAGMILVAIGNEMAKGLRQGWSERVQIVIELPLYTGFTFLISFIVGKGRQAASTGRIGWTLHPHQGSWIFLGIAALILVVLQAQKMYWRLIAEIQTGTLEQTYLSPLPSWVHVAAGRVTAATAEAAVILAVIYAVIAPLLGLRYIWRFSALVPLGFLLLGSAGLSLFIAGLTLLWKRIEMLVDAMLFTAMLFAGLLFPTDRMPGWARVIGEPLFLTHAVAALRMIMLTGRDPGSYGAGGLAWVLATALGSFAAGVTVFRACDRAALRCGSLARH
jgi:ABC-2 type transport system permease protein